MDEQPANSRAEKASAAHANLGVDIREIL